MRPQSITVLCILLFVIGASLTVRSLGQIFLVPGLYSFFMLTISLLGLYCYYGLWHMQRWCIPVFFLVWGAISTPVLLELNESSTIILMRSMYVIGILIAFVVVVLPHRKEMSRGPIWQVKKDT